MEQTGIITPLVEKPLFEPTYLNIEYVFNKIAHFLNPIIAFFSDRDTWVAIGFISSLLSIIFIAIILYSLIRLREIQIFDKKEIDHEINIALAKDKETERTSNPRWHYILTLIESSNESDWRVAIIEADTMLEELLREKGFTGETLSELLEAARESGYATIQNAWDAHLVRNQIAHQGSAYPLSQVEGRRSIKLYQNFFEEMRII